MSINKIITKKNTYILLLFILPLLILSLNPTYSKFTETFTTEEDIVTLNTNLNLNIENIYESTTITVGSNDYEIYDIDLKNNTDKKIYYSLWHKNSNSNITVAKLNTSESEPQGELEPFAQTTITLIIKNNSTTTQNITIGSSSSNESLEKIQYTNDTEAITQEDQETTIYYDAITDKYYFSQTNTEVAFQVENTTYQYNTNYQTYTASYSGYYQVELWGPSTTNQSGDYLSTNIYLNQNQSLYFYVGRNRANNIFAETDVRLIPGTWENENSLASRILIAGNDLNSSYIYSYTTDNEETSNYKLNTTIKFNIKDTKDNLLTTNTNQGDGMATIKYLEKQEPSIEGIEYINYGENYKLEDIICKDNGRGCNLIKVRPETTSNLEIGTYEIVYIVSDNDNITYKFTDTFEVIS